MFDATVEGRERQSSYCKFTGRSWRTTTARASLKRLASERATARREYVFAMKFSPLENYARFSAPLGNYALSRRANSITVSAWYCWAVSAAGDANPGGQVNAISPKSVALRALCSELSRIQSRWLPMSARCDLSSCPRIKILLSRAV